MVPYSYHGNHGNHGNNGNHSNHCINNHGYHGNIITSSYTFFYICIKHNLTVTTPPTPDITVLHPYVVSLPDILHLLSRLMAGREVRLLYCNIRR